MINNLFNKTASNKEPLKKVPREVTVRVIRSNDRVRSKSMDIEDIRKQYEDEESGTFTKSYSILGCGVVGALAGFLVAMLMFHLGIGLSSNEVSFLIGIPAFLGAFAGWAIF